MTKVRLLNTQLDFAPTLIGIGAAKLPLTYKSAGPITRDPEVTRGRKEAIYFQSDITP